MFLRENTKEVSVASLTIGGKAPVSVSLSSLTCSTEQCHLVVLSTLVGASNCDNPPFTNQYAQMPNRP